MKRAFYIAIGCVFLAGCASNVQMIRNRNNCESYTQCPDLIRWHIPGESQRQHAREAGEPVPKALLAPLYPRAAARRRISGYVKVRFDVLPDGTTTNIEVVESVPQGVFDLAMTDAVSKWQFDPSETGFRGADSRFAFNLH
ncbi:energy transducer TonB [Gilvimarinus sp. F26214L]|uniref:energy transducer TonB n=1 Tax=Gilvimarinus sp. DZF01 TaxID=3461371 RepID=UPI004045AFCF